MSGPDSSLFQGSEDLMIQNFGLPDDVEHEAEEDKRRMNEELNIMLMNAFDDVTDNDDDEEEDKCDNNNEDLSHIANKCIAFSATQEKGAGVLSRAEQLCADAVTTQDCPTSDSAVLESALTTVMSMGKPARNRYASHLAHQLPSVQEDDGMFNNSQEFPSSVDTISDHYLYCYRSSVGGYGDHKDIPEESQQLIGNELYREASYNSMEQLQVLYDVRVREVQRLSQQLQEVYTSAAEEKERISRELILSEADKQRAGSLHREAEKQLFSSKKKIDELEKEVATLKMNISSVEASNAQRTVCMHSFAEDSLESEQTKLQATMGPKTHPLMCRVPTGCLSGQLKQDLESSQASNIDLHQKLLLLERSSLSSNSKHYDSFVKNCHKKHEQELQALRNEMDVVTTKLNNKEEDFGRLEQRIAELTRSQDSLIIEKAEIINQMARSLEESQRQCQQLMGTAVSQDNVKLTMQLSVVSQEKEQLGSKVQELKKEVESLKFDLQQYENATHLGILNNEDSVFTDSMIQLGIAKPGYSNTKFSKSEQINLYTKFKDEFHRCLLGQRMKREEIKRLKSELERKDQIIKKLKEEEVKYLAGVEKFKEDVGKLMIQLKEQDQVTKEIENYEKRNQEILQQLRHSQSEVSRVNNEVDCIRKERDEHEIENTQLKQTVEKLIMEFENEKVHDTDHCSKEYLRFHDNAIAKVKEEMSKEAESRIAELSIQLDHALKESEEVKLLYIGICSAKEHLLEELHEVQENVQDLTNKLQTKKEECDMMSEELNTHQKLSQKLSDELKDSQEKVNNLTQTLEMDQMESKEQHMSVREMEVNKEVLQKTADDKARQLYTARVTEEINAAKEQALKEVEQDWKKREDDYIKIKQLTDTCTCLQEKVKDYDEKCVEVESCKKQIQELQTKLHQHEFSIVQLKMKEKSMSEQNLVMGAIRTSLKDVSTSPIYICEDVEASRTVCAKLHAAELEALKLKYQSEMQEQQEKIKQETVNYFAREILSIEAKHKLTLQECEFAAAKELASLQDLIVLKTRELDVLKQVIDDEKVRLQTASDTSKNIKFLANELTELKSSMKKNSINKQEKQIATLKSCLELKEKQLENIRNKVSELVSNCTREVQTLRKSNDELSRKYAECVVKYNAARMKAAKYKKFAEEKEIHLMKEYERIRDGYQNALGTIQKKVKEAVCNKETVITCQVIELEKQIQQLKQKQSKYVVIA